MKQMDLMRGVGEYQLHFWPFASSSFRQLRGTRRSITPDGPTASRPCWADFTCCTTNPTPRIRLLDTLGHFHVGFHLPRYSKQHTCWANKNLTQSFLAPVK